MSFRERSRSRPVAGSWKDDDRLRSSVHRTLRDLYDCSKLPNDFVQRSFGRFVICLRHWFLAPSCSQGASPTILEAVLSVHGAFGVHLSRLRTLIHFIIETRNAQHLRSVSPPIYQSPRDRIRVPQLLVTEVHYVSSPPAGHNKLIKALRKILDAPESPEMSLTDLSEPSLDSQVKTFARRTRSPGVFSERLRRDPGDLAAFRGTPKLMTLNLKGSLGRR